MVLEDVWRDGLGDKRWRSRGGLGPSGLFFDDRNVRSIDDVGALRIRWCNWAITDQVALEYVLELRLRRSPDLPI